jgi:hypothetical protein
MNLKIAQSYVGTPYEAGVFDCADLVAKVQQEVWGRRPLLPVHSARSAEVVQTLCEELARPVPEPETGDVVLMWLREPEKGEAIWHLGTVFVEQGCAWVLHNSARRGAAVLHRLRDLPRMGLRVEGFYTLRVAHG